MMHAYVFILATAVSDSHPGSSSGEYPGTNVWPWLDEKPDSATDSDSESDEGLVFEEDMEPEYAEVASAPIFFNFEVSESSAEEQVDKKLAEKIPDGWWDVGAYVREALAHHTVGKDGGAKVVHGIVDGVKEALPGQFAAKGLRMAVELEEGPLGIATPPRAGLATLRCELTGINLPKLGVLDGLRDSIPAKLGEQFSEKGVQADITVTASADLQADYWNRAFRSQDTGGLLEAVEAYAPLDVKMERAEMPPTDSCAPMTTAHMTAESIYVNILVKNAKDLVLEKVKDSWLPSGPVGRWMGNKLAGRAVNDGGTAVTAKLGETMVPALAKQLTEKGICVSVETLSDATCKSKDIGLDGANRKQCKAVPNPGPIDCERKNCDYTPGVLGSAGPLLVLKVTVLGLDIAKMHLVDTLAGQIDEALKATFAEKNLDATLTPLMSEHAQRLWLSGDSAAQALDKLSDLDSSAEDAKDKLSDLDSSAEDAKLVRRINVNEAGAPEI